jgi:hypothetical protein
MIGISSYLAKQIGSEPIIGAFLAGLALNKSIPRNSLLMQHIDFMGNVLFIPVFLIGIGMMINVRLLIVGPYLWYVTFILLALAFTGKWMAAWLSQKILKFNTTQRNLLFGLSSSHAAATIAIILIGYDKHLIDITIFNATVLIILASSLLASILTERAGKKLALTFKFSDEQVHQERILVPIANPATMANLIVIANEFQKTNPTEPVYLLNILNENKSTRTNILKIREALESNISEFNNLSENLKVITRVDLNISSGIIRAAKEYMISDIIIGWSSKNTTSQRIFGTVFDHLFTSTQTLYALKVSASIFNYRLFVVYMPENLEYEPAFPSIVSKLNGLLKPDDQLVFNLSNQHCLAALKKLLPKKNKHRILFRETPLFQITTNPDAIAILFLLRKQSVSYQAKSNALVQKAMAFNPNGNCIIVVPGFEI